MSVNRFRVDHMKWSVFWQNKQGKFVRKRFYDDFAAALKFYQERLDRYTGITLHVDNMGFPPPKRITEHERETWKVISIKGKKFKKKVITIVNLMEEYNQQGIWWCPYCIKLRRFKLTQTERGPEMYCPCCASSHRICKAYNPKAIEIEYRTTQQRTGNVKKRRRR